MKVARGCLFVGLAFATLLALAGAAGAEPDGKLTPDDAPALLTWRADPDAVPTASSDAGPIPWIVDKEGVGALPMETTGKAPTPSRPGAFRPQIVPVLSRTPTAPPASLALGPLDDFAGTITVPDAPAPTLAADTGVAGALSMALAAVGLALVGAGPLGLGPSPPPVATGAIGTVVPIGVKPDGRPLRSGTSARGPPPAPTMTTGPATVVTGDAWAGGNQSVTDIEQISLVVVTGHGMADINQQVDVVNTGTAVAISGGNTAIASGGAGIATGGATAVGNQSDTSVSQMNMVVVTGHGQLTIDQDADVVNSGSAVAVSGDNTASGGASSTGGIATGGATAVGNQSETSITQINMVVVTGHGQLTIDQDADVVNSGSAVAITGDNTASGGASSTGGIATGGATAVGNQSETSITQINMVVVTGRARLTIDQDANVVNVGDATAISGGNAAWAGTPTAVAFPLGLFLWLMTGSATATGNVASTEVVQLNLVVATSQGVWRVGPTA